MWLWVSFVQRALTAFVPDALFETEGNQHAEFATTQLLAATEDDLKLQWMRLMVHPLSFSLPCWMSLCEDACLAGFTTGVGISFPCDGREARAAA